MNDVAIIGVGLHPWGKFPEKPWTAMAKDAMAHDSMMKDATASSLGLASTSVDLAKHVGHKVTVKGVAGDTMGGMATFNVKSIKMVGESCS